MTTLNPSPEIVADIPPMQPPPRRRYGLIRGVQLAGALAAMTIVLGGLTVLLGWELDDRALQAVGPATVVMNPLAALLFILAGLVLLLDGWADGRWGNRPSLHAADRFWGAICGLAIALCGWLVLMRTLAGWQAGVDDFLFRDAVLGVDPPDWMAENTAINFLLLGIAILFRRWKVGKGSRPSHWLLFPVSLMSLLVVIGYLYGSAGFITFQLQLPMAMNTALFFLFACFALVAAHPNEGVTQLFVSDSAGGKIIRRLLPALLIIPLVLGALINLTMVWGWYTPTVALALFTLATIVLSVALTITTAGALHRSDLALRGSEEHYRALIENGSDYIMIVDRAGLITYVGPSVERLLGLRMEDVVGGKLDALIHTDDFARTHATLDAIFGAPGDVERFEFRIRHRNGNWRVFESFGRTLKTDTPEAGVVVNARDITERRMAENESARQRAYFEEILDSLDAGIVVFDPRGRFEYASASAMPEHNLRKWVVGKTLEDYGRHKNLPAEITEVRMQSLRDAIRTRAPNQFEQPVARPDGSSWQMLRRIVPLINEAGEIERLVAFSVDITERKQIELALQAAKDEAERANRAKSEFLSRMSHELRTPMNAILGFAQVLERKGLPPAQGQHVGHILKAGRHLLVLINEVLDLSRIESGRLSLTFEVIEIDRAIRDAMEMVRPIAGEMDITMTFDQPLGSEVFAYADRQRLSQILINLLSNAIKYNRAGGRVEIRAGVTPLTISIGIHDSGRGIPEDRVGQLFTPFARLGAEATGTEGTGLGLTFSRRLAEAMGGSLFLESTGAEGSTFRLEVQIASDAILRSERGSSHPEGPRNGSAPTATILYIEDNPDNLNLVEAVVESHTTWATLSARRGEEGIELARQRLPDLILLDLHLPDLPGVEVLRRLRADPATAEMPVIVISADATRTSQEELKNAGADGYLTKPLDLDEFTETVGRVLEGRVGAG